MKKTTFKKLLSIAALCVLFSNAITAQCQAGFTYATQSNGKIKFTNTSTGAKTYVTYNWIFGDGQQTNTDSISGTAADSASHTYAYNGTYYSVLKMTTWDNTGTCTDTISQVINVTNGTTCNIVPSFSYSIGANGSVGFTSTSTNVPVKAIYTWSFSNGKNVYGSSTAADTFFYNGAYQASLTISDTNGFCTNSTTQTFTITNANACNIHTGFTYTVGSNGTVVFTNTSTGTYTSTAYYMNFGDGSVDLGAGGFSSGSTLSHTYQANSTFGLHLRMGDSSSTCFSSYDDSVKITNAIYPACQAFFKDSILTYGNVMFFDYSANTTPTTVYTWNFGDTTATSSQRNPIHRYANSGTFTVACQISDVTTACSSTYSTTINIADGLNGYAVAQFNFSNGFDGVVNFTNTSLNIDTSSGSNNSNWDFGDGITQYITNPSHTYTANGVYAVTLRTYTGFPFIGNYTASVTVTNAGVVPCTPTATFTMHQDSLNPQPGVWELSTYYSPQVNGATWHWGDGTSTAGLSPTHTYSAAGHYQICVSLQSTCGDTALVCQNDSLYRSSNGIISLTVINASNTVGIKTNVNAAAQVSIYPNPSIGNFNISSTQKIDAIKITNSLGQIISQTKPNDTNTQLKIDNPGIYFIQTTIGGQASIQKVIVTN